MKILEAYAQEYDGRQVFISDSLKYIIYFPYEGTDGVANCDIFIHPITNDKRGYYLVADVEPVDPLVEHLRRLMDDEEIRRNPNIDLSYLALRLKTNRSYLSKAIQNDGYKNFSDMINRKRVAEFLKLADAGLVVNIQDSFFYVGFRSRETALRCFKKYVGMSPTDYLRFRMTSH